MQVAHYQRLDFVLVLPAQDVAVRVLRLLFMYQQWAHIHIYLCAYVRVCTQDGDGTVNGAEFSKAFFKLGFAERSKRRKDLLEQQRLKAQQAQVSQRSLSRENFTLLSTCPTLHCATLLCYMHLISGSDINWL